MSLITFNSRALRGWALCTAVCASSLLLPVRAHAEELPGGAALVFDFLLIKEAGNDYALKQPSTELASKRYFNMAHCACASAPAGKETSFAYQLRLTAGTQQVNRPAEVWVGTTCNNDTTRTQNCKRIDSAGIADLQTLSATPARPEISIADLMNPMGGACTERAGDALFWVLADGDGNGVFDYQPSQKIEIDTQAPPLPTDFSVTGAESAVSISWKAPTSRASDILYYQALCAKVDGTAARSQPSHDAQFQTVTGLCGLAQTIALTASTATNTVTGTGDVEVTTAPEGIAKLDATFICGQAETTATEMRIEGLANDVQHVVALVAVDRAGNVAGTYFNKTVTPRSVVDFWEDLIDRGSKVEGGYCLLASAYGESTTITQTLREFRDTTLARTAIGRALTAGYYRWVAPVGQGVMQYRAAQIVAVVALAPLVAAALAWHWLTLPGALVALALLWWAVRRVRRGTPRALKPAGRARLLAGGSLLVLLALPTLAHAQHSNQPYWEDDGAPTDAGTHITWHFGVRLGPYTPAIDAQFAAQGGAQKGPYERMFGTKYSILPMLDVDRVIWEGPGQLTVGASIGYMNKSAKALLVGSQPDDSVQPRSSGDENSFRLIPMQLTAGFRLTYFDDVFGIPLVPYLRGGLGYYMWKVTAPSGDAAFVCRDTACKEKNVARGGSLGLVGALGLAIRAEGIDRDAAASMRGGGIEHAGFYAELSLAKVDGFGSETKLSVGDATWFAGVNFEF